MSITEELVSLIRSKNISDEARHRAAMMVLDAVSSAIAGRNSEPGGALLKWSGFSAKKAVDWSFLLGALTHCLEVDDLHRASTTHPGCVVVPAALSLARQTRCSGHQILSSVLHGYEAMCRIGSSVGRGHYKTWHNTGTCGPFGSAMAAASILNLDGHQTVNSLGNAGTQAAGLWEFLKTGAMSKPLHAGRAAAAGVLASELAAVSFTGAREILEGRQGFYAATSPDADPNRVLRDPESEWQLCQTSVKPWPCCRHTHPAIDAAIEARKSFKLDEVEGIEVEVYRAASDVCDRESPITSYEAKFSIQHCVAVTLAYGRIGFDSFGKVRRTELAWLRSKIKVLVAERFDSRYPGAWGARLITTLKTGEVVNVSRPACKGDPEAFPTDQEVIDKALSLMTFGGVSGEPAHRLVKGVLGLAEDSVDWQSMTVLFTKPRHDKRRAASDLD